MKKITKILAVLIMAVMVVVTAAACGGSGSVVGKTFEFDKDASDFGEAEDIATLVFAMCDEFSIKFNNDGTCKVTISMSLLGETSSQEEDGTYKQDGSTVTIGSDSMGGEKDFKLEGGKLIMEDESGAKLVFSVK